MDEQRKKQPASIRRKNRNESVFAKTNGRCWFCGEDLNPHREIHHKKYWTIDHVVPRSKGGTFSLDNLVPSCYPCNELKSNMPLSQFRILIMRLSPARFATLWRSQGTTQFYGEYYGRKNL